MSTLFNALENPGALINVPPSEGGGGGITEVADWASRGTGEDGEWLRLLDTGALFRWSDAVGRWVRPSVFDGTPVLQIALTGTVEPDAESPAWTEILTLASAQGSISSDGTLVTLAAPDEGNAALLTFSHGVDGGGHYVDMAVQVIGTPQSYTSVLLISTGGSQPCWVWLDLRHGGGGPLNGAARFTDENSSPIGATDGTILSDARHDLELVVDTDWVYAYVDRKADPACACPRSQFHYAGGTIYEFGIRLDETDHIITVKDGEFYTY